MENNQLYAIVINNNLPEIEPKYVTFWDFKGNVLAAYDEDELATIEYPTPPDYSGQYGITFYEWSETLDEIRNTTRALDVIARYESDTEKIYVNFYEEKDFILSYRQFFKEPYVVDWGDGTVESITSTTTHHFNKGTYKIEITPPSAASASSKPINNSTFVGINNTEDIIAYIADKYKSYQTTCPIICIQESATSYSFYRVHWFIRSYRRINNQVANVDTTTYYPNAAVNDCKGLSLGLNAGVFNGKVLKMGHSGYNISPQFTRARIIEMSIINGTSIIPIRNASCAEYVYFPDNLNELDFNKALPSFSGWNYIRKITNPPQITSIPANYCNYTKSLKEFIFNGNETSIGNYAFWVTGIITLSIPSSAVTFGKWAFRQCFSLTSVVFNPTEALKGTLEQMFYSCFSLRILDCKTWNLTNITNVNGMLAQCKVLETLCGDTTLEEVERNDIKVFNGLNVALSLSDCTLLNVQSLVAVLNGLADRTSTTALTLTLGSTNKAKLTPEQIAIATNKNWNVA